MNVLSEQYKKGNVILFVGAGVSKGLGIPDWQQLIDKIAEELQFDADVFNTYGDHLSLAEYYLLSKGGIGSLRSWMDREWHSESVDIKQSKVHQLIVQSRFRHVYTTNYDRWLEQAHTAFGRKFIRIANVSDLVGADAAARHIVKFHGDFEDDDSIVLGESSYFDRLDFESPLDQKLRADVLGSPVLFIGYSLTDFNIRLLFYKLNKLWKASGYESARPQSYVFQSRPNPIQEKILEERGIKVIGSDIDDPGTALEVFLGELVES